MTLHGHHRGPGRPPVHGNRHTMGDDRRHSRRFRIDLLVELPVGTGTTRDVSESGLLFDTTQNLPLVEGDPIDFDLVLGRFDPQGPYRVKCAGEVVRVEHRESGVSVAVTLRSYDVAR